MSPGVFQHWPNRLTAMRFVGALILFLLLALGGHDDVHQMSMATRQTAFWLFVVVACTDFVDGYLARRDNLITAFGRVSDPFVDKVLVLGTMIFLAEMDWSGMWFPAWVVVVVLSRELLVTGLRGYAESLGVEFPADWSGKIKMILQCIAIGIVLGIYTFTWPGGETGPVFEFWKITGHFLVGATLFASVLSGVTYVWRARKLLVGDDA